LPKNDLINCGFFFPGFMHYRNQLVLIEKVSNLQKFGKLDSNVAKQLGLEIKKRLVDQKVL